MTPENSELDDHEQQGLISGDQRPKKNYFPSQLAHFSNFCLSFTDGSILAFPFFIKMAGAIYAPIIFALYMVFLLFNIDLLLKTSEALNYRGRHLHDLIGILYGNTGRRWGYVIQSIGLISVFISAVLITVDFSRHLLCTVYDNCVERNTIVFACLLLTLLIALVPNIKVFSKISVFCIVLTFVTMGSLVVMSFTGEREVKFFSKESFQMNWNGSFVFLSALAFTVEGVGLTFPLRSSYLEKHDSKEFNKVYILSLITISLAFFIFGYANYLRFGNETQMIIFVNYPPTLFFLSLEISFIGSVFLGNLMDLFPFVNEIYEMPLTKKFEESSGISRYWIRYFIRTLAILFCFIFCFFGLSFTDFLMLSGGVIFIFIGIVLPSILYNKANIDSRWWIKPMPIFGGIIWIITSFVAINQLIET